MSEQQESEATAGMGEKEKTSPEGVQEIDENAEHISEQRLKAVKEKYSELMADPEFANMFAKYQKFKMEKMLLSRKTELRDRMSLNIENEAKYLAGEAIQSEEQHWARGIALAHESRLIGAEYRKLRKDEKEFRERTKKTLSEEDGH